MADKHQVLVLHAQYPELSNGQIAERLGCDAAYVRATLSRARNAKKPPKPPVSRSLWTAESVAKLLAARRSGKSYREIAIEVGRPLSSCAQKYREETLPKLVPHFTQVERPREIPQSVIADAMRRSMAEKSLTAQFFGDPAPGYSALDKKQGAFA